MPRKRHKPEEIVFSRLTAPHQHSRGGLVDELAVAAALDEGQISGAGFDVATVETCSRLFSRSATTTR